MKGNVDVDGYIKATENISDKTGSMQEMREVYNDHKHGNSPLPTEPME